MHALHARVEQSNQRLLVLGSCLGDERDELRFGVGGIIGLGLVLIMLFRPAGLLPSAVRKRELTERDT